MNREGAMDVDVTKVIAAVIALAAVVLDWPRALAGLLVGYFGRRTGYPMIAIPAGIVAVAAFGEVIYPLFGRTAAMSWGSFVFGLIAAGATAYGLFRWLATVDETRSR